MIKTLLKIHPSPAGHWVGDGFPVRSIFMYNGWGAALNPFLLLDYVEPRRFPPSEKPRGVEVHPHRGFETVTIAYQGALAHRDSSGGGGRIGPGDVQWMTAGSGLVHEEFHDPDFTREGGTLEMVQLWVNLPAEHKRAAPGYQAIASDAIPTSAVEGGGSLRVIAGEYNGIKGPARTFTPIDLWDLRCPAGSKIALPLKAGRTSALFLMHGEATMEGAAARRGDLAVFSHDGEGVTFETGEQTSILVLSGEPIAEPVVGAGPFVMNTREEIAQAIEDYEQGRMGVLKR